MSPLPSQMVSRELERECIVVFDEAHNIDNVCIEALSVNLRMQTLDAASRNIGRLNAVSFLGDTRLPHHFVPAAMKGAAVQILRCRLGSSNTARGSPSLLTRACLTASLCTTVHKWYPVLVN